MIDQKLHVEIDRFLEENKNWKQERASNVVENLYGNYSHLYIRLGSHRLLGRLPKVTQGIKTRTLDISSVEVRSNMRSRGIFTNLLNFVETKNLPLFVENVLNDRLGKYIVGRGYQLQWQPYDNWPKSYYKLPPTVDELNGDKLIGIGEIADLAGVTKQAVVNWRRRTDNFPEPITELAMGPIFLLSQIQTWLTENNKVASDANQG